MLKQAQLFVISSTVVDRDLVRLLMTVVFSKTPKRDACCITALEISQGSGRRWFAERTAVARSAAHGSNGWLLVIAPFSARD